MKVTGPQVRAAMKLSGGNITKASEVLGIARNNLYKRLISLGIEPAEYRGNTDTVSTEATAVTPRTLGVVAKATALTGVPTRASVSSLPSSGAGRRARTFRNVIPNRVEAAVETSVVPVKKLRPPRTVYLRPEQYRALDDACLDLGAALREKLSVSKVVERFMDDCFEGWLSRMKAAKRSSRKGGEKP